MGEPMRSRPVPAWDLRLQVRGLLIPLSGARVAVRMAIRFGDWLVHICISRGGRQGGIRLGTRD
jgi:hypothetical protein